MTEYVKYAIILGSFSTLTPAEAGHFPQKSEKEDERDPKQAN